MSTFRQDEVKVTDSTSGACVCGTWFLIYVKEYM
jgi:hypothetical protein